MNHARLLATLAGLLLCLSAALHARAGDIQKDNIEILSQSGDSRFLLARPKVGQFVVLDSATLEQISPTLEPEDPRSVTLSYDGGRLAVCDTHAKLSFFDTKSGKLVSSTVMSLPLKPQTDNGLEVHLLVYSRDGKEIVIVSNELIIIVDVATGREITRVNSPENWQMPFAQAELNPDKTQLLTIDGGRHPARLWDAHTGKLLRILDDPLGRETEVNTAIFSPDGQLVATGEDILEKGKNEYLTAVRTRESRSGRILFESKLEGRVLALAFSQDGKQLAAAGRQTRVFDVTKFNPTTKKLHSKTLDIIDRVAFSPDGNYVMANAPIGFVMVWEVRTQQVVLEVPNSDITSFAGFAGVGHVLITGRIQRAPSPSNPNRVCLGAAEIAVGFRSGRELPVMRRPTRTRRLSIAAIVSLLAFGVVASAGIRSFWDETDLPIKGWGSLGLSHGTLMCQHVWDQEPSWNKLGSLSYSDHRLMGFAMTKSVAGFGAADRWVEVPLWFPLLLLLIAPVRWLIARPPNAPAFPVVTDAKQEHS